jgi:hypothetical protein
MAKPIYLESFARTDVIFHTGPIEAGDSTRFGKQMQS